MVIRTVLDTRRATKNGKFPVKLRFTDRGKLAYVSLNIYALPDEFDEVAGMFFALNKKDQRKANQDNAVILSCIEKANLIYKEYQKANKYISPAKLKDLYDEDSAPVQDVEVFSFSSYLRKFADEKTDRTKDLYETTIKKVEAYAGKDVKFEEITYQWLVGLEKRLKTGKLKINTISIHFRNIRSAYNDAITNDVIGMDGYPFRKFKIQNEKTRKRSITVTDIRKLFAYTGTEAENWAVDMAKLLFFLRGINVKDLYLLNEYENGYLYYRRAKTSGLFAIKVEPEVLPLIEKYKGENGRVFSFSDRFKLHVSFIKKINKHLSDIAGKINMPELTTYVFRHTWATIAAELEIPKETIAAGLGHDQNSVTDIYIAFSQRKIDEANRRVIDYVLKS